MILFNVSALAKKTGHGIVSCIEQIRNIWKPFYPNRYFQFREGVQKKSFFRRYLPNLFSHQPTPGFLWDLGAQKVNFRSSRNCDFHLGNCAPTPPCLGEISQKKTVFFLAASLNPSFPDKYLPLSDTQKLLNADVDSSTEWTGGRQDHLLCLYLMTISIPH